MSGTEYAERLREVEAEVSRLRAELRNAVADRDFALGWRDAHHAARVAAEAELAALRSAVERLAEEVERRASLSTAELSRVTKQRLLAKCASDLRALLVPGSHDGR